MGVQRYVDRRLLERFDELIWSKVPHLDSGAVVSDPTPLLDLTNELIECAKVEYKLDLSRNKFTVFGKLDAALHGGSVKVRPAVAILRDAIESGELADGMTVFEATSGNFGIALGLLGELGIRVVVIVSRRLQDGVLQELEKGRVETVNLDMDICPAPGVAMDQETLAARVAYSTLRERLGELGFDLRVFDAHEDDLRTTLTRQDMISLAGVLAGMYRGFCPRQYENELNPKAHESVTAPEIDQQLKSENQTLAEYRVVTTFGTGGTSSGVSRYVALKYGKKAVHVVFPLQDQDVAGIRTRAKAVGLKFYEPERYVSEHEADFEGAKKLLRFFVSKGYDFGESSALALFATLQMVNYGVWDKFVVMIADGVQKYRKALGEMERAPVLEVTPQEAISSKIDYSAVLWTHGMFVPTDEGIRLVAASLGLQEDKIQVVGTKDVEQLVISKAIPETVRKLLPARGRTLLVCMAGGTSLRIAQVLVSKGIEAQSLTGGIVGLSAGSGKSPPELVQVAST